MRPIVVTHTSATEEQHAYRGWLLAHVIADRHWSGGSTDTNAERPVFMVVATSHGAAGPLAAALGRGARAEVVQERHSSRAPERFELLRSAGYRRITQAEPEGVIHTFYLPELYQRDPGMVDPEQVTLAVLPRAAWVQAQRFNTVAVDAHLAATAPQLPEWRAEHVPTIDATWTPQARLFGEALDRRTLAPFPGDDRFLVQLLRAAVLLGLVSVHDGRDYRARYQEHGLAAVGLARGLAFGASQDTTSTLLAEQVQLYFQHVGARHGAA